MVVGWDAADWKMIHPLMDQGLTPATKKLVEGGVVAPSTPITHGAADGAIVARHQLMNSAEKEPMPDI